MQKLFPCQYRAIKKLDAGVAVIYTGAPWWQKKKNAKNLQAPKSEK